GVIHEGTGQQHADQQALGHPSLDEQSPEPDTPTVAGGARRTGLAAMTWQLATDAPQQPSRSRQLLANVGDWARRHKLEAVALVLLGLGGGIFPPVWLAGAAVALASGLWDYRDKWVAVALPILLTLIGTAAGIAIGSRASFGHGIHEAWAFAVN